MKVGDIVQVINKLSPYYGDIGNISAELDKFHYDFEVFLNPDFIYFSENDLELFEEV